MGLEGKHCDYTNANRITSLRLHQYSRVLLSRQAMFEVQVLRTWAVPIAPCGGHSSHQHFFPLPIVNWQQWVFDRQCLTVWMRPKINIGGNL